jgi:hypothetical protein
MADGIRWRLRAANWLAVALALIALVSALVAPTAAQASIHSPAGTTMGPFATLLFSRTEMTAADDCAVNDTNVARIDTVVAPYLASLGLTGTGTLTTSRTYQNSTYCVHFGSSRSASWSQAARLAATRRWSFVSHTATYPVDISKLTPTQQERETCGSAQAIDAHGLPGGHGLLAMPGVQAASADVQRTYGARCFAWGRRYGHNGVTSASAGTTFPYWQWTMAVDGGACNDPGASCFSGLPGRYDLPSAAVDTVRSLQSGQWYTLQAYLLVWGKSPAYSVSPIRWDCTSPDPRLHWTNDNERYCWNDYKAIVSAIAARGVSVTDPLSVGIAFGRPSGYP